MRTVLGIDAARTERNPSGLAVASEAAVGWQLKVARSNASLLLRLPSVIVPEESDVLINPRHSGIVKVAVRKFRTWLYDPRTVRGM